MSIKQNIKAVIFDLDGTLVHSIEDLGYAANTLFRRHGYPEYATADFIRWVGKGAARFIEQGIGSVIDKNVLKDYVNEFKRIYAENLTERSSVYEGIPEMILELQKKEIKLSILSNKPHELTLGVVKNLLSEWSFKPVFGQRETVPRKPDPAAALEIAQMLHLQPHEMLFVGDSEGDIRTAEAAGMVPLAVTWGYGSVELAVKNGHAVIDHPAQLIKHVK